MNLGFILKCALNVVSCLNRLYQYQFVCKLNNFNNI